MSPRMEDTSEDMLKQEGKQSLIREVLDLRAQVETLTAGRDRYKRRGDNHAETLRGIARMKPDEGDRMKLWARDGLSGATDTIEGTLLQVCDERNEANARALASDTARASAETALRPLADFAARIAAERPGWDHDAFELFRASSPDIDQDWLLLTMAPFRRARAAMENRT